MQITRVDVTAGSPGYGIYSGGASNYGWVSMCTMLYTPTAGTAIAPLMSGWTNQGTPYRVASITTTTAGLVMVSGVVSSSTNPSTVATGLPAPAGGRRIFGVNVQATSARVDVTATGVLTYVIGKGATSFMSLSGINYFTTSGNTTANITSSSITGATPYGNGYAEPGFIVSGGICYVGGVTNTASSFVGTLPASCRPAARVVTACKCAGTGTVRVDVLTDGRIFTIAGACMTGAVSLEGIMFKV